MDRRDGDRGGGGFHGVWFGHPMGLAGALQIDDNRAENLRRGDGPEKRKCNRESSLRPVAVKN